jgi:putative transposase
VLFNFPYYGNVRVSKELKRRGSVINHKKAERIMKKNGLFQKRKKYAPKTTNSRHLLPIYPNLVKDIVADHPKHIWVSDITYVRLAKGFCYVAIILDVFTKKIVGWAIELHMEKELVIDALKLALLGGAPEFHHSDRGGQYCSYAHTNLLKENGVKISMADTGVSVDNPYAESWNRTLKVEEVYLSDYETIEDARRSIKRFIEEAYNKKRLHSSIGYQPPEEFEREWLEKNGK